MTALEAYALAKKIAVSAVSGIKSLSVSGTTLIIETNDGNTISMVFPTPADGRGITKTEIDSNNHLIVTYDDGATQDAGPVPEAEGGDYYVIDTLAERPAILGSDIRRTYYCIENQKQYLWDGIQWSVISSGGGGTNNYEELNNKPSINGTVLSGNQTADELDLIDQESSLSPEQLNSLLDLIQ